MRLLFCLLLLVGGSRAWDTPPHRQITKAALDSLPKAMLAHLGAEAKPLIEIYCIYPDRYQEMAEFGFVRKSEGPQSADEIAPYCLRPDGEPIHGASGDWEADAGSLVYLFERILTNLAAKRPAEVARFAGVLSHFIADSLSPPHADSSIPREMHAAIERSIPDFSLAARPPRSAGDHLLPAAKAIFDQLYAEAGRNRQDLPAITVAVDAHDEAALNRYRLRAGTRAAQILADALFTLFRMASLPGHQ